MRSLLLLFVCLAVFARAAQAQTQVKVPHLVGLKAEAAKQNLEWLGLQIRVDPPGPTPPRVYQPPFDDGKLVQTQDIAAGTDANPGTIVAVVLVTPPEPGNVQIVVISVNLLLTLLILFLVLRCCCKRTPVPDVKS